MDDISFDKMSGLDKLDYRRTIQMLLEDCYRAKGTIDFGRSVDRLVFSVETKFPGIDLQTPIKQEKIRLLADYYNKLNYVKQNDEVWFHPLKRGVQDETFKEEYWSDLLEFIRDLLAKHRGLWFGIRHTPGGTQMNEDCE